jgi:U4/U6.U5 tri-snRNP-associated protein 1
MSEEPKKRGRENDEGDVEEGEVDPNFAGKNLDEQEVLFSLTFSFFQKKIAKLAEAKRKRREKKSGGSLGEALEGSSTTSWLDSLSKSRKKTSILSSRYDEQDEEFLRPDGFDPRASYTAEDVQGIRVMHDIADVGEGEEVIMTLADRNVLDDDDEEEVLQNINMVQKEKQRELARFKSNAGKPVYDVYDHDAPILAQYDDPEAQKKSFVLGQKGAVDPEAAARLDALRAKAALEAKKLVYDVGSTQAVTASDYLTREEMAAMQSKRKKPKKEKKKKEKKSRRHKKTSSALVADLGDGGDEEEDDEEEDRGSKATGAKRRKERSEAGNLQNLLEKESRYKNALKDAMKQTKAKLYEEDEEKIVVAPKARSNSGVEKTAMSVAEKLALRAKEKKEKRQEKVEEGLVFSSTSEFLKSVKLEDEEEEEEEAKKSRVAVKKEATAVKVEDSAPPTVAPVQEEYEEGELPSSPVRKEEDTFIKQEAPVAQGMAATLQYLQNRGGVKSGSEVVSRLTDGSVSRTNKVYDDEVHTANFDLQKYDEFGRPVSRKEAFRLLSQGFHGNAPGPMAQERRLRNFMKDQKMKQKMTSEATLKALDEVERRQKETGSAGIKLSVDTAELEEMQEQAALLVKKRMKKEQKK